MQALASLNIASNFSQITGVKVNVMTIGVSNANAFAGVGYQASESFSANLSSGNLTGLSIQNLNMGLAIFTPVSSALPSFTAAQVTASTVSLTLGSNASGITLFAQNVEVDLNLGGPIVPGVVGELLGNATINFQASTFTTSTSTDTGYFAVPTGTNTYLDLDYSSELIQASVANATLQIFDFVYVTGSFAFVLQEPTETVNVTGGLTSQATNPMWMSLLPSSVVQELGNTIPALGATSTQLSILTVGASNVYAFVGVGNTSTSTPSPYWETGGDLLTVSYGVSSTTSFNLTGSTQTFSDSSSTNPTTLAQPNIQTAPRSFELTAIPTRCRLTPPSVTRLPSLLLTRELARCRLWPPAMSPVPGLRPISPPIRSSLSQATAPWAW